MPVPSEPLAKAAFPIDLVVCGAVSGVTRFISQPSPSFLRTMQERDTGGRSGA
jgi:hypothetical protein